MISTDINHLGMLIKTEEISIQCDAQKDTRHGQIISS